MRVGISGINGSGKTTLAKKLSEAWNYPVVRIVDTFHGKPNEVKIALIRQWRLLKMPENCIMDRCWLDRKVYTKFYGTQKISRILNPYEVYPKVTIYIDEKAEIAFARQNNHTLQELKELKRLYRNELFAFSGTKLRYDRYIILIKKVSFWNFWSIQENLQMLRIMPSL
ncbi:MAG: hypothetical protein N2V78_09350 [Methanophagales archaeon]|nr:hypothetical protein [Methanophagales archaeon]